MANKYVVTIRGKRGGKDCPGDSLSVRKPRVFTQDYLLRVRVEFSEKPTPHEHRIVTLPLFDPAKVDITQEGYDQLFEYDEGERLCGSTDATVTVTASVSDEQDSFRYTSLALPPYGISKSLPVHMMMNMIDHLKMWLPKNLPGVVLDLCDEGRARMEGDTRTWHIERTRDKAAVLARKRLPAVRDSDRAEELATAKRDNLIGKAIGYLRELQGQGELISKAALARKLNLGSDGHGKSTRTQAMNKALRRNGIDWKDLLKKAGVNLTQKRRR
jgi:hypothetical protein